MNAEESISTLKFADRAKQVMIQAKVNEIRPVDHALVLRLQKEVEYLKDLLRRFVDSSTLEGLNLSFAAAASSSSAALAPPHQHQMTSASGVELEMEKMSQLISENESLRLELQQLHSNANAGFAIDRRSKDAHSSSSSMNGMAFSSSSSNKALRRSYDTSSTAAAMDVATPTNATVESFMQGLRDAWQGQSARFWDRFDQMEVSSIFSHRINHHDYNCSAIHADHPQQVLPLRDRRRCHEDAADAG
jgi:hypothetical protein